MEKNMTAALKENNDKLRWSKRLTEGARQQPDHLLEHINETFRSVNSKFPIAIEHTIGNSKTAKDVKIVVKK